MMEEVTEALDQLQPPSGGAAEEGIGPTAEPPGRVTQETVTALMAADNGYARGDVLKSLLATKGDTDRALAILRGSSSSRSISANGSAASGEAEHRTIQIRVKTLTGSTASITCDDENSIATFKDRIAEHCDVSVHKQRLVYRASMLDDGSMTLREAGIVDDSVVHLVIVHIPKTLQLVVLDANGNPFGPPYPYELQADSDDLTVSVSCDA